MPELRNLNPFIFIILFIAFIVIAQLWFNTIYEFIQSFYEDENPPVTTLAIISAISTIILTGFIVYFTEIPITVITVG